MATTGTPLDITLMNPGEIFPHSTFNAAMTKLNTGVALVAWTPTWTNLTLGNGTVVAKYQKIGKLVVCRISIVFGSTTVVSGDIQFSLPVTSVALAGTVVATRLGLSRAFDTSASISYEGSIDHVSTTLAGVRFQLASGTYVTVVLASATIPFTWATGDEIAAQFHYEAA